MLVERIEAVTRQDHAIAALELQRRFRAIDFGNVVAGQGAHQHIARKAGLGFDRRTGLGHAVEEAAIAMVGVLLSEIAATQQIQMTVADADPAQLAAFEHAGHQRATHALQRGGLRDRRGNRTIGLQHGLIEDVRNVVVGEIFGQVTIEGLHRHIAGDIARRMATHAVGDDHHGAGGIAIGIAEMRDQERIFLIVPSPVDLRS